MSIYSAGDSAVGVHRLARLVALGVGTGPFSVALLVAIQATL